MKTKILFLRLCCTVIVFAQLLFTALAQGNPGINITAVQVEAPLLKGLPANPLVRLDIVVKRGVQTLSLQKNILYVKRRGSTLPGKGGDLCFRPNG